jgi:hypothetical protein
MQQGELVNPERRERYAHRTRHSPHAIRDGHCASPAIGSPTATSCAGTTDQDEVLLTEIHLGGHPTRVLNGAGDGAAVV